MIGGFFSIIFLFFTQSLCGLLYQFSSEISSKKMEDMSFIFIFEEFKCSGIAPPKLFLFSHFRSEVYSTYQKAFVNPDGKTVSRFQCDDAECSVNCRSEIVPLDDPYLVSASGSNTGEASYMRFSLTFDTMYFSMRPDSFFLFHLFEPGPDAYGSECGTVDPTTYMYSMMASKNAAGGTVPFSCEYLLMYDTGSDCKAPFGFVDESLGVCTYMDCSGQPEGWKECFKHSSSFDNSVDPIPDNAIYFVAYKYDEMALYEEVVYMDKIKMSVCYHDFMTPDGTFLKLSEGGGGYMENYEIYVEFFSEPDCSPSSFEYSALMYSGDRYPTSSPPDQDTDGGWDGWYFTFDRPYDYEVPVSSVPYSHFFAGDCDSIITIYDYVHSEVYVDEAYEHDCRADFGARIQLIDGCMVGGCGENDVEAAISAGDGECGDCVDYQGVCVDGRCKCYFGYTGSNCGEIDCGVDGDCGETSTCVNAGKCACAAPNEYDPNDGKCIQGQSVVAAAAGTGVGVGLGVAFGVGGFLLIPILILTVIVALKYNEARKLKTRFDEVEMHDNSQQQSSSTGGGGGVITVKNSTSRSDTKTKVGILIACSIGALSQVALIIFNLVTVGVSNQIMDLEEQIPPARVIKIIVGCTTILSVLALVFYAVTVILIWRRIFAGVIILNIINQAIMCANCLAIGIPQIISVFVIGAAFQLMKEEYSIEVAKLDPDYNRFLAILIFASTSLAVLVFWQTIFCFCLDISCCFVKSRKGEEADETKSGANSQNENENRE